VLIIACYHIPQFGYTSARGPGEWKGVLDRKVVEQKIFGRANEDTNTNLIILVGRGLDFFGKLKMKTEQ
jgi:hypothetical protein